MDGWYFDKLGQLTSEGELKKFFDENYKFIDDRGDQTAHWCDGHINFNSREELYDLVKMCWRGSLKIKVMKDLKE